MRRKKIKIRLISNSETTTWLTCRRKYYFEYFLDLEPKQFSDAISNGILYHACLEAYYAAKSLGGEDEEFCRSAGIEPLIAAMQSDNADIAQLGKMRALLHAYWDHYASDDDRYEVYAVETKLKIDLSEDYAMVGTIDLIWKDKETGKYWMVDHKSAYNFWTEEQAEMTGQFTKYVVLGRNAGLDVAGVIVNQLRTRELKPGNELFRRIYIRPTEPKIRDVLKQHMNTSFEIMGSRNNIPVEDYIPVFNKFICANCSFLSLCDTMSNGADIKYGIQQDYRKRTGYGYNG